MSVYIIVYDIYYYHILLIYYIIFILTSILIRILRIDINELFNSIMTIVYY